MTTGVGTASSEAMAVTVGPDERRRRTGGGQGGAGAGEEGGGDEGGERAGSVHARRFDG